MSKKRPVDVICRGSGDVLLRSARWCSSYLCKLRGLQFRRSLQPGESLILVHGSDSVSSTSIHMFFVFFPIAAVWVNGEGIVTHKQLAKPWRPYYASPAPARYVIEAEPEFLERVQVGDQLEFR